MASDYTSSYTGAQIDEGLARARNDEALIQDQVKADTSGSLILSDDSGNGLTILDGGNTSLTAGKYHSADSIRALSASGLGVYDDSGQGPLVNDGGIVTNAYQPSFSAYVNITQENVTGDGTIYNLTGSFFTEIHDNGSNFSNGIFTAPVTSNKYKFGITLDLIGISSSHTYARLYLKTSNLGNRLVALCNPYAASYSGVWAETYIISDVEMDINDTANFYFDISNGTKIVDVYANNTRIWGGLE